MTGDLDPAPDTSRQDSGPGPAASAGRPRHQPGSTPGSELASLVPAAPGSKQAWRAAVHRSRSRRLREDTGQRRCELAERIADAVLALPHITDAPVACYISLPSEPPTDDVRRRLLARGSEVLVPWLRDDHRLDWVRDRSESDSRPRTDSRAADRRRNDQRPGRQERVEQSVGQSPPGRRDTAPAGRFRPAGARLGPAALVDCSLVLLPALAADTAGRRLGRGKGSYDRTLADLTTARRRDDGATGALRTDGGSGGLAFPASRPLLVAVVFEDEWGGELVDGVGSPLPVDEHDQRVDAVITARRLSWCSPGRRRRG